MQKMFILGVKMTNFDKFLNKDNFKFNKSLGQNFICDSELLKFIVASSGIDSSSEVLEIGAGEGTLTSEICKVAKKVISFEVDKKLQNILAKNLSSYDNLDMIFKDILRVSNEEIKSYFAGKYDIIANLPYYITTPIILKFISDENVKSLTIMVQKEVAEKLVATPDDYDYKVMSLIVNLYGNVKIVKIVDRSYFTPVPNVDSAIIKIDLCNKYDIDKKFVEKVIKASFSMRRKTLLNNLLNAFSLNKEQVLKVINDCGYSNDVRGEQLTIDDFIKLSKFLKELF
jgi:16S rRNA (adenine1518-N6/adenine1519-N6)-dimethyltransferase